MEIAYCIESMYNSGGMERILSTKANYLAAKTTSYGITIIIASQQGKPFAFDLSDNVKIVDLHVNFSLCHTLLRNKILQDYKKKLQDYLNRNKHDIVISMGGLELFFLHTINDGSKKIVEFHFCFDMLQKGYTPRTHIQSIRNWLQKERIIFHAKRYEKIVALTQSDDRQWRKYTDKVVQIYNPITSNNAMPVSSLSNRKVVAIGRLHPIKGFDDLIRVWKIVNKVFPTWKLDIYGKGSEYKTLSDLIDKYQLGSVVKLKGFVRNPFQVLKDYSLFVMTSKTEGFPLVLIEASCCGLPLISYNCPSGPSEIIENGVNGYLIHPVGNIEEMAERICHLINDEELRKKMGEDAKKMSDRFCLRAIMDQWEQLFSELTC